MIKLLTNNNNKLINNNNKININNEEKLPDNINDKEKLHVIIVISNPCLYNQRYKLMKEFIKRMDEYNNDIILYIVELIYKNQNFVITDSNNKNHLQLYTEHPLWHKENMINVGVEKLLPFDWKYFAWIDADIEFLSKSWANDAIKLLNTDVDIIQLFKECNFLNKNNEIDIIYTSLAYHINTCKYLEIKYYTPGYAWAIKRSAYEQINKLVDFCIIGSGDSIMAYSIINNVQLFFNNKNISQDFIDICLKYQENIKNLNISYINGNINHYYHGNLTNRKYLDRWQILTNNNFNFNLHITYNNDGIIIPTNSCPTQLLEDIFNYFKERNEDD
jgi:hypothetical protein